MVPTRPNSIYVFQRNLERIAKDRADLIEQIRITLYHELGHYLGFEEEDMDDLGLA
jgi:predicted Zn-dependent protease with MMP-like domain